MIEGSRTVDVGRSLTVVNANAAVSAIATAVIETGADRPMP
ncbi:hypothetical protein [Natronosalvus caseinilyticus]|nr:hypothetical protein [Natronosalvus caseinilyticus]